jgi:uncharacterized protein (TIGR03437 family)
VNSASYRAFGSAGSGIAQGSIFTVFGTGLGPDPYLTNSKYPLQTTLGGTSVTVTVNGTSTNALILLAYGYQVNAILPSTTPTGSGSITVTYNSQTSASALIQVVASSFGIYTFNSSGTGQAVATNSNYQSNTIIQTFHPGDVGVLWGTGLGAVAASDAQPPPTGNVGGDIQVYVGNSPTTVLYHGRSGFPGLDQINFQVPTGVLGCQVPIAVQSGGTLSNVATIAVSASGQTCSDSIMGQDLVDKLASGQNVAFGYVRLENSNMPFMPGQAYRASMDYAAATFSGYTPQLAGLADYGVSPGYCIVVDCSGGCGAKGYSGTLVDSSPAQLDAGPALTLDGQGTRQVPANWPGYGYYASLLNATTPRILYSGYAYTVSGAGGKYIGAFSATETTSTRDVAFTNLSLSQAIPRSTDLTVKWDGADPAKQNGQVTIGGVSVDDINSSGYYDHYAMFQCIAPAAAKSFTIPGWILSTLPASGLGQNGTVTYPLGWIWIGQYNNPVEFQAPGLDRGIFTDVFFSGTGVLFK